MCISLPMIHWFAFPGAFLLGLSNVLECLGGLQMAMVWLDKHPAAGNLHWYDWPVNLAIKLVTVCDYLELKWASNETIWQWSAYMHGKTCHFMAFHHPQPPPLCNHLWYWCKNYIIWQAIYLAAICRIGQLKDIVAI